MEDFVRKTRGVRDINSLPLDTNHELDIVSDVKGKIYIKILNRYKELLFDNGTEHWVTEMLNKLEVDVEQLKEDILDVEQALTELPIIEDKLEAVETKLAQINTLFAQMQIDVQGLDLRTAELEREVVQLALKDQELLDKINNLDLGKISTLYSNSIDFGDYDYSGKPNLIPVLKAKDFSPNSQIAIEDSGNSLKVTFADSGGAKFLTSTKDIPALLPNTQYTLSADVTVLEGYKGNLNSLRLTYRKAPGGNILLAATARNAQVGKKTKIYSTNNSSESTDPSIFDRLYFSIDTPFTEPFAGTVLIENIKLEYGSTATPFQPNLLTEPYNMCREYPNENMVINNDPTTSNAYLVKSYQIKPLVKGKTYTITLKGTKPSTQTWRPFFVLENGTWGVGDMTPVPGLTNVWVRTFTAGSNSHPTGPAVQIYQAPSTSAGQCKIDWCKLEEGDTRTPNIPYHKYVGINLKESENPNDYQWIHLAKSAETVDARLTKTISTYDTVNALQNNRLTSLESKVVDTTWQDVTVTEPFTSVTQPQVKKQNGIVYMRGTISNGTGDCFTLPEGFRPPAGAYEMQFRLPCRSADATDYATMYVRPSGLCSIAGVNGTKPIFLSGIIFSTT